MNISFLLVAAGIVLAILSAFTRIPVWVGVLLIGLGVLVGVK